MEPKKRGRPKKDNIYELDSKISDDMKKTTLVKPKKNRRLYRTKKIIEIMEQSQKDAIGAHLICEKTLSSYRKVIATEK